MPKVARWIVLACLFIIPFLVLYVSDSLYFPFITGKGFAFRVLVEIALAAYVVLALVDKKYRPQFSWTLVLYGALVVWMAIADAFAVSPFKAFWSNFERMDGWITLVHVFVFFVIAGTVLSVDKLWKNWWLTFLSASALVSLYSVFQLLGVLQIHQGGVRVDATLGNAEYLAGYLLFAIAIALWQALESKGWLRYALYILAALHVVILYYTETRGAVLAFVGALALGAILWMIEAGKRGRKAAGIVLAIVVVLVGGFFAVRNAPFVTQSEALSRLATISVAAGETRFTIWHMAWEGFLARPVTGWGQEGFNYVFNTYYDPSLYNQEPWFDRAHNVLLDWLSAGGLPALLLFLALLVSAVVALYRGTAGRAERVILLSALAAYVFQGLFVFDNLFTYIPLAAILALAHQASMRPSKRMDTWPALVGASAENTAASIGAVVAIAVIWFVNVPNIAAAHDIVAGLSASTPETGLAYFKDAVGEHSFGIQEIAEQLVSYAGTVANSANVSDTDKTAVVSYALQEIKQVATERPLDARILLQYAIAYRTAGDITDALTETQAALALSPEKYQILLEEGLEAWQLNNLPLAEQAFSKTYTLAPGSDDAAVYAAAGKIITGDVPGGKAILTAHFGTTTPSADANILVYAYYGAKSYTDMIPVLEEIASADPSVENEFELASGYALVGRITDARALINATIQANPSAESEGRALLSQIGAQ